VPQESNEGDIILRHPCLAQQHFIRVPPSLPPWPWGPETSKLSTSRSRRMCLATNECT
jgi:hypothetical protein